MAGHATLVAQRGGGQLDVFTFITAAIVRQRKQPIGRVGAQAKLRILLLQLKVLDGILLRHQIAEGESTVVGAHFDGHGAMAAILFDLKDQTVVGIVYLADLLVAQCVVVDAAARLAVDDPNIGAKRRSVAQFEAERRVIEDWFAVEAGRIIKSLAPDFCRGLGTETNNELVIRGGELKRRRLCERSWAVL